MALDLSKLMEIGGRRENSTQNARKEENSINTLAKGENATEGKNLSERGIQENINQTIMTHSHIQKARIEASQLQADIIKGIQMGEDVYTLLLKACETIALITQNPSFCQQVNESIRHVRGLGLLEQTPLNMELEEMKKRLSNLLKALDNPALPPQARSNIENAIKMYVASIDELEKIIKKE